jgi:hypothetical protein
LALALAGVVFAFRLLALVTTLLLALLPASTRPASRLVALRKYEIAPRRTSLANYGVAAGRDLRFLESCSSSS